MTSRLSHPIRSGLGALLLAIFLLPSLAPRAAADELRPDWVDADATWLLHIDVERLVDSALGQYLLENSDEMDLDLDDVQEELGIDPAKDIYGVTLYGENDPDEDGTVILVMTDAVDRVLEAAQQEDNYREVEADGFTLHRWDEDEPTYAYVARMRNDRRLVILSNKKMRVVDAIRVMEGDSRSLRDAVRRDESRMKNMPRSGSLVFGYAAGLPWLEGDDDDPASAIARRSDRLCLEVRERASTTTLDLFISAKSKDDARNISEVLTGLIALGKMMSGSDPDLDDLSELLQSIQITSDGNDITIQVEGDSDQFAQRMHMLSEHLD